MIGVLRRWILERVLRAAPPLGVCWPEFQAGVVPGERREVVLRLHPEQCLSAQEMQQLERIGAGPGLRSWWLRHQRWGFARLPLPAANEPFVRHVYLPPGRYILGCGVDDASRHFRLCIGQSDPRWCAGSTR